MSEEVSSVHVNDATRVLTPITTTSTSQATHENGSPTSPELPTVVATKPPTQWGALAQGSVEDNSALSPIPESRTDETVTADKVEATGSEDTQLEQRNTFGDKGDDADDDGEAFTTPEVQAESLPSPELTSIPLSPADPPSAPHPTIASANAEEVSSLVEVSSPSTDIPKAAAAGSSPASPEADAPGTTPRPPAEIKDSGSHSSEVSAVAAGTPVGAGDEPLTEKTLPETSPISHKANPSATTPRPLETTNATVPAGLDSLLSPTETEAKFSIRQSVAASDTTDDDTRFSTVLLSSARQSLAVSPSTAQSPSYHLHTVDEGTGSDESTLVDDWKKHKKTASNSTILSGNNVPYLADEVRSRPNSLQGAQQIKEEYNKRQYDDAESAVDWGASCRYTRPCAYSVVIIVFVHRLLGQSNKWCLYAFRMPLDTVLTWLRARVQTIKVSQRRIPSSSRRLSSTEYLKPCEV